jgi:hypothetical protein
MLEQPGDLFTDWSPKLTDENARDDSVLRSRLIMSWHGGPVPEIVLQAIRTLPD